MSNFKMLLVVSLCFSSAFTYGQKKNIRSLVFSAVMGSTSKSDTIKFLAGIKSVELTNGNALHFKMVTVKNNELMIAFSPPAEFIGISRATATIKPSSGNNVSTINLTGLSTQGLEGRNEAPLSVIVDALGYSIDVGWKTLDNHSLPNLMGDEISSGLFTKATKEVIEIIPVARYSPDFKLPFGYYINSASAPLKKQVGVLATKNEYPQHQILFPSISEGSFSFDPGTNSFGFYADGPAHTGYSENSWNMALHPDHVVHATRIYPVKDKVGKLLAHTYLVCFEEAKNGDYNDYVFLVKNVSPVKATNFISLFNGKNLDGWNTFLRGIGTNQDPNNNFQISDGSLFVVGKELGYAITKKGYNNYHFKVDFKWGEHRWPPRDTLKRDAGICYNISTNEPDSIWPQSIECQIQEGDCGDFWLLSNSTITVDGKTNLPSNHTRMIKKRDAEKPTGEWNTIEVISYNGRCVHIVNGVVVNVGEEASARGGRILLQSEYAEIYYRNMMIREL